MSVVYIFCLISILVFEVIRFSFDVHRKTCNKMRYVLPEGFMYALTTEEVHVWTVFKLHVKPIVSTSYQLLNLFVLVTDSCFMKCQFCYSFILLCM